jgi:hypothetical protein
MNMKLTNGLLGLGALLIASQASAATVSVIPAETIANVGDPFTLTVQGSDFLDGVSSGSISLTWDPTAMTATSTLADVLATAPVGFTDLFGTSSLVAGQLNVTLATFGAALPSTFDFISIDFVANTLAESNVGIAQGPDGLWQDGNLQPIPAVDVTYVGATLNPPPAIPVPAAVWLFGSGLIGLVGVARRKAA